MSVPEPGPDGIRRYGRFDRAPEDTTRCAESVGTSLGGSTNFHQCMRKRGHGPGGLYCYQHSPEGVAETERRTAKKREAAQKRSPWVALARAGRRADAYRAALEAIAAGHNDPRALAAEALKFNPDAAS